MITFDRKKVSLNRKTLGLVVMLSMISGVVIIILFYATEMLHIHRRAVDSLHEVMEQVWLPSSPDCHNRSFQFMGSICKKFLHAFILCIQHTGRMSADQIQ